MDDTVKAVSESQFFMMSSGKIWLLFTVQSHFDDSSLFHDLMNFIKIMLKVSFYILYA